MIIIRAPLRLEFLGGSTDIEYFYTRFPGRVLNATLNKCVYVAINPKFDERVRVSYTITENVDNYSQVQNTRVKVAMKHFDIERGIEIISIADVPGKGSGLGSSSSFMVALVQGLSAFLGQRLARRELAETACHLEIDVLEEPIGKQDQYAAAYGGINYMQFAKDGGVKVNPIFLAPSQKNKLQRHLMFFYTGKTRSASEILKKQKKNIEKKIPILRKMSDTVPLGVKALQKGDLKSFAKLLDKEWSLKKDLVSGISSKEIETMYQRALSSGAWGGRVSGAGGGGFLFLVAPPNKQQQIRKALSSYREISMRITEGGSQILFRY